MAQGRSPRSVGNRQRDEVATGQTGEVGQGNVVSFLLLVVAHQLNNFLCLSSPDQDVCQGRSDAAMEGDVSRTVRQARLATAVRQAVGRFGALFF